MTSKMTSPCPTTRADMGGVLNRYDAYSTGTAADWGRVMDSPDNLSGAEALAAGVGSGGDTSGLFHTSEVRWFARGPLPPDVQAWFTREGTMGAVERRNDTYQLYGLDDIGVKRRHRTTLEVKMRRTLGASLILGEGLEGRIEEWSRWEPGEEGRIWQSPDKGWIGVQKVIYTRSFMPTDREVILPAIHTNRLYAACDVEVAEVVADGIDTWTLALKAFGPTARRQQALTSSWRTLQAHSPSTENLEFALDRACGYPGWLRLVT
jgi:hypothetical protein